LGTQLPKREAEPATGGHPRTKEFDTLIALGVILLILGFVLSIPVLWTIGIVLLLAGAVLAILGGTGRRIGGRAHWF
jgi:hypothetical protein